MRMSKINIYEMAEKADVSIATISRAINPDTRAKVAPDTLRKINRLIKKHGYTPNLAAKNLSLVKTKTIGVIFPYLPGIFYSSYYNHILSGVSNFLFDTEYQLKMLLLKVEYGKWDNYDFRVGDRVDGLIITHWFKFFSKKSILEKINVPCVVINDLDKAIKTQFVGVDNILGGQIAANHLYSLGHRRIAILSGPDWSLDNHQRLKGFLSFFDKKGVKIKKNLIYRGDYLENIAYGEVEKLISKNPDITAIFACNDQMAIGAIKKLKELGIMCPKDISVIGFDDDLDAEKFDPAITTVRIPIYDIAKEGTRLLIDYLRKNDFSAPLRGMETLPIQLVKRKSTSKAVS